MPISARGDGALWLVLLWAMALALGVAATPGCSCRAETAEERAARLAEEEAERVEEERKRRQEERRRAAILVGPPRLLPDSGQGPTLAKPGHYHAVAQPASTNARDFDGVLAHEAVGRDGAPLLWPGARTRLLSQRPVAMARESAKVLESLAYCPLPRG
ncbi:MAG: hypothetical protein AAF805_12060, partial [Planctomycetota bacterium]